MNEEQEKKPQELPKPPPSKQQGEVTNPALIQELTESVKAYTDSCNKTLEMEMSLRSLKAEASKLVVNHSPEKDAAISKWDAETALELSCMFDKVAVQMLEQSHALGEQAANLRRMNSAISAVKEEAFDEEG